LADLLHISEGQHPTSGRGKSDFREYLQSHTRYGDAAVSNVAVSATVIRSTLAMVAGKNAAFKIAAKPLQRET